MRRYQSTKTFSNYSVAIRQWKAVVDFGGSLYLL